MPTSKLTHNQYRQKVCIVCFGKAQRSFASLSQELQLAVKNLFDYSVSFESPSAPSGFCITCRIKLGKNEQLSPIHNNFDFIHPNFENGNTCKCLICQTATRPYKKIKKGKSKIDTKKEEKVPDFLCSSCLTRMTPSKLKAHHCSEATFISNFCALAKSNSKAAEAVTSQTLKNCEPDSTGTIRLSQSMGGNKLSVTIGPAKAVPSRERISFKQLRHFQNQLNLSQNSIRKTGTWLNSVFGRGTVEEYLYAKLKESTHIFDENFTVEKVPLFNSKGQMEDIDLVYCNDLSQFCLKVMDIRQLDPSKVFFKLGIDKGDGYEKFTLSVVDLEEDSNSGDFKSSGVKKVFIVAISHGMKENYFNLKTILTKMNTWDCRLVFSGDLLVCNILCGIQSPTCNHPCFACETSDMMSLGNPRTFRSLVENFKNQQADHAPRNALKNYFNVEFLPLLAIDIESDFILLSQQTTILCSIPSLHLLTGSFQHWFDFLKLLFPPVIKWVQDILCGENSQKPYHGGVFVGNQVSKLLKNIDSLQLLARQHSNFMVQPVIEALRCLGKVKTACFGSELKPNYHQVLAEFRKAVADMAHLGCSVTPKIHYILFHVGEWCDREKIGMAKHSEQTLESCHHKFHGSVVDFKLVPGSEKFGEKMLRAVCVFNSKNI